MVILIFQLKMEKFTKLALVSNRTTLLTNQVFSNKMRGTQTRLVTGLWPSTLFQKALSYMFDSVLHISMPLPFPCRYQMWSPPVIPPLLENPVLPNMIFHWGLVSRENCSHLHWRGLKAFYLQRAFMLMSCGL